MGDDALVKNASDPEDVGRATRRVKTSAKEQRRQVRAVLSTRDGRQVLWRLLEYCRPMGSVFDLHPTSMAHNSGKQDVGHYVVAEITKADPNAYLRMMVEAGQAERNERRENEAIHAQRTSEDGEGD